MKTYEKRNNAPPVFPANDVDPSRPGGWIVDLSPVGDSANPDFYYRFPSRRAAKRFASLFADGMNPEQAITELFYEELL